MTGPLDQAARKYPRSRAGRWAAGAVVVAAVGALTLVSDQLHPATGMSLLALHTSAAVLVGLTLPKPRSHAYSALAIVLFLGYWPKFVIRLIAPGPYLEPIGRFDGTPESWDHALLVAAVGFSGVVLARVAHILWVRRTALPEAVVAPPQLYARHSAFVWTMTAACVAAGYAWNIHASVYVTGVNPTIILPFSLNVVLAWCYIMAFPLWIAVLIGWELQRRHTSRLSWPLLLVPLVEGILNAGSLLSRASYLLRIAPYLLAATRSQPPHGPIRLPRPRVLAGIALAAGFSLSIVSVMALRTFIYLGPAPEPATVEAGSPTTPASTLPSETPSAPARTDAERPAPAIPSGATAPAQAETIAEPSLTELRPLRDMAHEVSTLFLDRWTGLEGVLVVTGSERGTEVLAEILQEDPHRGTESIYQKMAEAHYEPHERFTFLTLAGVIALLATANSWWLILFGMALTAAFLMLAEGATRRITHNEIACSVVAVTGAFVVSQVTYPRLLGVFAIELWATLAALAALMWLLRRADRTRTR